MSTRSVQATALNRVVATCLVVLQLVVSVALAGLGPGAADTEDTIES